MTALDIRQELREAAARLRAVRPAPTELSAETRQHADAAVDGVILVYYNGEHRVATGRRQIDWRDPSYPNGCANFLHRMSMIPALAVAYHLTGEEGYAEAARDYLAEYMAGWPLAEDGSAANITNTLDLSARNTNWVANLPLLCDSPAFDAAFVERVVGYCRAQFQYLSEHMSTTINWRVFNARALLMGSLALAFLPEAARWQRDAVRILNDAWFRQFLPDGVHYERNPIYHGGMANTFRDLYRLGQALPELGLAMTLERLMPIYDFMLACAKPNGYLCGLHDSQSDFTGHVRDGKYAGGHKAVDNTAAWEAFRRDSGLPLTRPSTSQVFPDAGLAFLRTGWDEDALWMSFDATTWGGGHCHLGRNAVQLHAHRQSMVIDPGWLAYESNDWGRYGRSTRAHSTCNLNGLSQSSTDPSGFRHYGAPGYDAVFASYEGGYWDTELAWTFTHAADGLWAQHARLFFRVQDRFAFVADSMFRLPRTPGDPAEERPSFECVWQLAPDAEIALQPDRAVAQWAEAGLLLLVPIRPDGARFEVHAGETDPLRGWVPGEHAQIPAAQVVLNTPRMDQQHDYYVTVLVPYAGQAAPAVEVEAKSPRGTTGYVKLRWADGSEDAVYWGCNFGIMLGEWEDFDTDASLVHLRKDPSGAVTGGCCVNGTYCAPFAPDMRPAPETFTF